MTTFISYPKPANFKKPEFVKRLALPHIKVSQSKTELLLISSRELSEQERRELDEFVATYAN